MWRMDATNVHDMCFVHAHVHTRVVIHASYELSVRSNYVMYARMDGWIDGLRRKGGKRMLYMLCMLCACAMHAVCCVCYACMCILPSSRVYVVMVMLMHMPMPMSLRPISSSSRAISSPTSNSTISPTYIDVARQHSLCCYRRVGKREKGRRRSK